MVHPFITDAQATQKIQESYKDIVNSIGTGFQGTIKIADTKTESGIYIPTEAGVYPNAGGLEYAPEVDDEGVLVMFIYDGTDWVKNRVELPEAENKIKEWDNSKIAINGEQRIYEGKIWQSNSNTIASDIPGISEKWESVIRGADNSLNINKGSEFPFINYGADRNSDKIKFENIILDAKVYYKEGTEYDYGIVGIYVNNTQTNISGNGFIIKRKHRTTQAIGYGIATSEGTTADSLVNKKELEKLSLGGIQTVTINKKSWDAIFTITLDTDIMVESSGLINLGYNLASNEWDDFLLDSAVHVLSIEDETEDLVTEGEIGFESGVNKETVLMSANRTSATINKGKDYPFEGFENIRPEEKKILNNFILDARIEISEENDKLYEYSISGVYVNRYLSPASPDATGIVLKRRLRSTGETGGALILNDDERYKYEIDKMLIGGLQTITIDHYWGVKIQLVIDSDVVKDLPNTYLNFGYSGVDWINFKFVDSVIYRVDSSIEPSEGIKQYDTFQQALKEGEKGLFLVGQTMARANVSNPVYSGDNEAYRPDLTASQFDIIGDNNHKNTIGKHKLIRMLTPDGHYAVVKSICETSGYVYFSRDDSIYRTKKELTENPTTYENTEYEHIIIPMSMPEADQTVRNHLQNVYEMANGELLIECRVGPETVTGQYQSRIPFLYVTNGMNDIATTVNTLGIKTYTLTSSNLTKVAEYVPYTSTRQGWSISMEANNIAIAPYGPGRSGIVIYSNDYGKSFKTIFNMDVPNIFVDTRPGGGSIGAWPTPESLTPPMPSNMWDLGGSNNRHTHGVIYDKYWDRIWVFTGDGGSEVNGVTAIWYTDDFGVYWTRLSTQGAWKYDAVNGFQGIRGVATADYLLFGSDSSSNGYLRYNRKNKNELPILEPAWYGLTNYDTSLSLIEAGTIVTDKGIYGMFHPNSDFNIRGRVVYSRNGLNFETIYMDEYYDGIERLSAMIDWSTWLAEDKFGNILIQLRIKEGVTVEGGGVLKLY